MIGNKLFHGRLRQVRLMVTSDVFNQAGGAREAFSEQVVRLAVVDFQGSMSAVVGVTDV